MKPHRPASKAPKIDRSGSLKPVGQSGCVPGTRNSEVARSLPAKPARRSPGIDRRDLDTVADALCCTEPRLVAAAERAIVRIEVIAPQLAGTLRDQLRLAIELDRVRRAK